MEKFIEFSKKYCLKQLGIITIISLILYVIFYGKQDVYLVDVSREAYIPWQMLKGQLLYKDIFNVYGPLGYQINAIAYAILGIKLNTLYLMGFLNSLIICFTTFFISKLFTDKKTSLCITGLTVFVCVYAKNFFNFIFVYSYNAVYALTGFLLSLLFALLYIRDKKTSSLIYSFLFAGFSFANKIEDLPYFAFLFLCLPFLLKKDWKKYLYALGAFMIFPVLSFGILFLQGVSIRDLFNSAVLIKKLVDAPVTTYFYYNYGLYFNPNIVKYVLYTTVILIKILIPFAAVLYGLNLFVSRYTQNKFLKSFVNTVVFFAIIYIVCRTFPIMIAYNAKVLGWLGMAMLGILILTAGAHIAKPLKTEDKMFVFLLISSILVSLKGFFNITITCYGTFTLAALFMPFVIFFVKYIPQYLGFLDKTVWQKTIQNLCVTVIIAFFFFGIYRITDGSLTKLQQPRGTLFIKKIYAGQNAFISYIRNNTPKDAVILTVPEGAMINFLAERDSHNMFYYLIPVNVQIFGEDFILKNLEKNPPDYFVFSMLIYSVYGVGDLCSYAPSVCGFIDKNYKIEKTEAGPIGFALYKRKF